MSRKVLRALKNWGSDVLATKQYLRYREKEDRRRRLAGQFLTMATLGLGIYYILWHARNINWDAGFFSFIFFLAEVVGLVLFSFFAVNAWFLRYHAPEGLPHDPIFSVDVFITVAGEPVEILTETVAAATKIVYPRKKIYILDDRGTPEVKDLAERFGCGYLAREEHPDAKAGNLNYALGRTSGDLILTLDADQIPHPQILNKLFGYFKLPLIAFVQTKQNFKVPAGDPFGNTDRIFYNVMQSGKDTDNAAFSCGSGVLYRRKALEDIGGFSTWNLVEDVHTSMLLHQKGWRSIYYNHPLTVGSAPASIHGVYRQRRQWAADSLRILFWDSPFFRKGLSLKQKLQYFHLGFVYLVAAFIMPLFYLTPVLGLLKDYFVLVTPVPSYVLHRFPYFMAMSVAYAAINYPTPYMRAFQMWTGLFPPFIQATWIALFSPKRKPVYQVNSKDTRREIQKNPWIPIFPQIGIIVLSLFAVIFAFVRGPKNWDFYLLNSIWAVWSVWTMSGICVAALKKHRWLTRPLREKRGTMAFLSRTKELTVTLGLTVAVMLFFVLGDEREIDRSLTRFRLRVLAAVNFQEPTAVALAPSMTAPEKPAAVLPDREISPSASAPGNREIAASPEAAEDRIPPPAAPAVEIPPPLESGWVVHVVSVRTEREARIYSARLNSAGFRACSCPVIVKGENWIRVSAGLFPSQTEARIASQKMKDQGFTGTPWIERASLQEIEVSLGNKS